MGCIEFILYPRNWLKNSLSRGLLNSLPLHTEEFLSFRFLDSIKEGCLRKWTGISSCDHGLSLGKTDFVLFLYCDVNF